MQANTCLPLASSAPLWASRPVRPLRIPSKSTVGPGRRTTVALEPELWAAIECLAEEKGLTWRIWAEIELAGKPEDRGAASWLRVRWPHRLPAVCLTSVRTKNRPKVLTSPEAQA